MSIKTIGTSLLNTCLFEISPSIDKSIYLIYYISKSVDDDISLSINSSKWIRYLSGIRPYFMDTNVICSMPSFEILKQLIVSTKRSEVINILRNKHIYFEIQFFNTDARMSCYIFVGTKFIAIQVIIMFNTHHRYLIKLETNMTLFLLSFENVVRLHNKYKYGDLVYNVSGLDYFFPDALLAQYQTGRILSIDFNDILNKDEYNYEFINNNLITAIRQQKSIILKTPFMLFTDFNNEIAGVSKKYIIAILQALQYKHYLPDCILEIVFDYNGIFEIVKQYKHFIVLPDKTNSKLPLPVMV